jgi:hypothetical protein
MAGRGRRIKKESRRVHGSPGRTWACSTGTRQTERRSVGEASGTETYRRWRAEHLLLMRVSGRALGSKEQAKALLAEEWRRGWE